MAVIPTRNPDGTFAPGAFQQALMRMLATAPDGLLSADLAPCATTQDSQQRQQALVNIVLHRLQARGFVARSAHKVPHGTDQRGRAYVWQITETGREWLEASGLVPHPAELAHA